MGILKFKSYDIKLLRERLSRESVLSLVPVVSLLSCLEGGEVWRLPYVDELVGMHLGTYESVYGKKFWASPHGDSSELVVYDTSEGVFTPPPHSTCAKQDVFLIQGKEQLPTVAIEKALLVMGGCNTAMTLTIHKTILGRYKASFGG